MPRRTRGACGSKARTTRCRTATSSRFASTCDGLMPWLLREGQVLAAVEVAERLGPRWRGLLGRDGLDGAYLLKPARSIHTVGMRFSIDVAYCDRDLVVLETVWTGR